MVLNERGCLFMTSQLVIFGGIIILEINNMWSDKIVPIKEIFIVHKVVLARILQYFSIGLCLRICNLEISIIDGLRSGPVH